MGCINDTRQPMQTNITLNSIANIAKISFSKTLFATPYEKVLLILNHLKERIRDLKDSAHLQEELQWVIEKIESKELYTFNPTDQEINEVKYINQTTHKRNKSEDTEEELTNMMAHLNEYSENPKKQKPKLNIFTKYAKNRKKYKISPSPNRSDFLSRVEAKIEDLTQFESISDQSIVNEVIDKRFNIIKFYENNKSDCFSTIAKVVYQKLDLIGGLNTKKLDNFLDCVKNGYSKAPPYHNEQHGADVGLTIFNFIYYSRNYSKLKISKLLTTAMVTSAFCHDIGHPGFNNSFHVNSISKFAIESNDKSVLENFHIAQSFKILLNPDNNIIDCYSPSQFKKFRKVFIETILATDMMFHARTNSNVRARLVNHGVQNGELLESIIPEKDDEALDVQIEFMNFFVHTADLSHNSKLFEISYIWVERLTSEFWNQGDQEVHLRLPISFLCDRETNTDIPSSQIGFIKGVIVPSFEILNSILQDLDYLIENVENNLEEWAKLKEKAKTENKVKEEKDISRNDKNVPFDINIEFFNINFK